MLLSTSPCHRGGFDAETIGIPSAATASITRPDQRVTSVREHLDLQPSTLIFYAWSIVTRLMHDRWAVDDDDANAEDQQPQASSKRPKAGKEPAQLLSVLEEGQGQAAEVFDGLTAGLDGLIDPKSGKGKSGPASHGTSSKVSIPARFKLTSNHEHSWQVQCHKIGTVCANSAFLQAVSVKNHQCFQDIELWQAHCLALATSGS